MAKGKYRPSGKITGLAFGAANCSPAGATNNPPAGTAFAAATTPTLNHVHLQLVFWGGEWNNNPFAQKIIDAVTNLLGGPYMNFLAQYGVRRASYKGAIYVVDCEPGSFNIGEVSTFLIKQLDNEQLPEPDSDWPIVFGVIMPTNSAFQGDGRVETVPLPQVLSRRSPARIRHSPGWT